MLCFLHFFFFYADILDYIWEKNFKRHTHSVNLHKTATPKNFMHTPRERLDQFVSKHVKFQVFDFWHFFVVFINK